MRSVLFVVAAGAAALLSGAALAADLPPPPPQFYAPPPPPDFGGWYLRGDIGFSNQRVKNLDNANYSTLLSLDQRTGFDTAGIYGVGIGYQFNNWLRGDITAEYRGNANFHGLDLTTYNDTGTVQHGSDTYTASKSEWLFLANAYADLGTWYCVTPFVGFGVGMARNTISNFTDAGVNGTAAFGAVPGLALADTASKWNFAWAIHAGLAYQVSRNMTVELSYRYVDLGDGMTGDIRPFDGPGSVYNPMTFHDITSHDVRLGLRWNLEAAPVYAPPPLITKG